MPAASTDASICFTYISRVTVFVRVLIPGLPVHSQKHGSPSPLRAAREKKAYGLRVPFRLRALGFINGGLEEAQDVATPA